MKHLLLSGVVLSLICSSCATISGGDHAPPAPVSFSAGSMNQSARKIRKDGSMHIKSRDLPKSSEACVALVASHKAVLQSARLTEEDYRATIRVPSDSLKPLMSSLNDIGRVTSQEAGMSDVTSEYQDLEALLHNKRTLRDRLRQLLAKAENIKDTLAIEKKLSEVQTELDQLEARMKTLRSEVALSTLHVNIDRERIPGPLGVVTKGSGWVLKKLFVLN